MAKKKEENIDVKEDVEQPSVTEGIKKVEEARAKLLGAERDLQIAREKANESNRLLNENNALKLTIDDLNDQIKKLESDKKVKFNKAVREKAELLHAYLDGNTTIQESDLEELYQLLKQV